MTREQLAREIYRLDEKKAPHKTSEDEYVKRCLKGVGAAKPFLKAELEQMYQTRLERQEKENQEEKEINNMKKFEIGAYKVYIGTFEAIYYVEKVTEKTVTITIHKGGKYEKTKRCKIVDNETNQYCKFNGMFFESDNESFKEESKENIEEKLQEIKEEKQEEVEKTYKECQKNRKCTKRERIMQYVKKQVNVDLSIVRTNFTKNFERRNEIIVEFRELSKEDWRKVEMLAANKKIIRIEDVGVWGKMIALST